MKSRTEDGPPPKAVSRWVLTVLATGLLTATLFLLTPLAGCAQDDLTRENSANAGRQYKVQYSVDQESAAALFQAPDSKATTAGLIKWLKKRSDDPQEKQRLDRRLVLSWRLIKAEKEKYKGVDIKEKMKKAADEAGVELVRLSVDDPQLEVVGTAVGGQPDPETATNAASEKALEAVQLAADLGCKAIDFPLRVTGGYKEGRDRAAKAIVTLAKGMARKRLDQVALLFRNDAGLSANGNWIAEVIRKARVDLKAAGIAKPVPGVVLDVSKLEYRPDAFLNDLAVTDHELRADGTAAASNTPSTGTTPGPGTAASAGNTPSTAGTPTQGTTPAQGANPAAGTSSPSGTAPASGAASSPGSDHSHPATANDAKSSLVKVIVLDVLDPHGSDGQFNVRGLSYLSSGFVQGKINYVGDLTLCYRGFLDFGDALANSRVQLVQVLGPPAPTASRSAVTPGTGASTTTPGGTSPTQPGGTSPTQPGGRSSPTPGGNSESSSERNPR